MRKLATFTNVTLDGYFAGPKGELEWAHRAAPDPEWNEFVAGNAQGGGTLLLGRVTYDMMVSYWPTPLAKKNDPAVAEGMNKLPKIVFSRTLDKSSWENTTMVKGDVAAEVRKLKQASGDDIAILGSGSIISQLAQAGLIDEYQLVVHPIILGQGKSLFAGVEDAKSLKLTQTRAFANGNVLHCYEPAG
ncbi:MAG TPA: dihydrofolate reductase family protein [Gemmatimonadales bacterium]|jgi:dihydrofolate reductase